MRKRLLWRLVFVCAAIGLGLAISLKPWQLYREQRAIADRDLSEMRRAEGAQAELIKSKAYLESKAGREARARDAGFRKAGEVPPESLE